MGALQPLQHSWGAFIGLATTGIVVAGTVIVTKQALHLLDWACAPLPSHEATVQTPARRELLVAAYQQQSQRLVSMKQAIAESEAPVHPDITWEA